MQRFFVLLLCSVTLFGASDIDQRIKKTSNQISSFSKDYEAINQKMAQTAREILEQKNQILLQQRYLERLQAELGEKETSYGTNKEQLKELQAMQQELQKAQEAIEQELVFTIAQSVTLSIILQEDYTHTSESVMEFEVLESMLQNAKERANELNKKFYANAQDIDTLRLHASTLEVAIANIDTKRKDVIATQEKTKQDLHAMEKAKESYKKELQALLQKQDTLKKTLAQLNIIKIDAIKKAKEDEERKRAFEAQQYVEDDSNLPQVKKHGSSYQEVKTKRYTGPKTIAPLDAYTVTKKYGNYTDPIYGIKIFNESISLKPKATNSKVKNVFNGKVIYADKTAVLDNIVIVEHDNGLHTIYANLSQIAPDIKKGVKIKKGYTIGRVNEELVFEVTQQSYHINPISLF